MMMVVYMNNAMVDLTERFDLDGAAPGRCQAHGIDVTGKTGVIRPCSDVGTLDSVEEAGIRRKIITDTGSDLVRRVGNEMRKSDE